MDTSRTTLGSPGALKWLHTRSVGVTFRIYRAEYQQSRTYIVQAHRALSLPRPVTVPLTTVRVPSQSAALLACSLGICGVCMPAVLDAESRDVSPPDIATPRSPWSAGDKHRRAAVLRAYRRLGDIALRPSLTLTFHPSGSRL